jgi:hypothetical protein
MAYTASEIEKIKAEARKYEGWVHSIDKMIEVLEEKKAQGENCYYDFNGHKCYSLLDDQDSCYVKITGKTKEKYDADRKKWHEEYEIREAEEKEKANNSVPAWIEEGKCEQVAVLDALSFEYLGYLDIDDVNDVSSYNEDDDYDY